MKKIYLTTAIDYANGKPHLGHLYERLIADTLAKYLFLFSTSIRFLIGLDEHGLKSQSCAVLNNVKPKLLTHLLSLKFQSFFIKFGVLYSLFVRTSCKVHEKNNNYILKFFWSKGLIYRTTYKGFYSRSAGGFIASNKKLFTCKKYTLKGEYNYFLKINKVRLWLLDTLYGLNLITPKSKNRELLIKLKFKVSDLCITRPIFKVRWALTFIFDKEYTVYVWFEALISYITGACFNKKNFYMYWPPSVQVIGKDILAPSHGIYYLTILKYLELKLPFKLLVHNWWLINEVKISKSLGNGLDLAYLILKYKNARLFNFFIIKEFNLNKDSVYSFIQFKKDYRYYYANLLLNLISRVKSIRNTISFKLPPSLKLDYSFHMYKVRLYSFQKKFFINIKRMSIDLLVKEFFIMIKKLNHYWDYSKPWKFNNNKVSDKVLIYSISSKTANTVKILLSYVKVILNVIPQLNGIKPLFYSISQGRWHLYKGY